MRIETDSQHYTDIAEAIRVMNGTENTYYPEEMASAIRAIPQETYDVYAPIIYSLEEREVGVWTDGKPLYQKVIAFNPEITVSSSSWTATNIDSTDIDYIILALANYQDGTGYGTVMADPTDSNHTKLALQGYRNGNNIFVNSLILQYTKTTDVPGSGTWGTDGVPMVHYDGTERIIGTWFGETLYQKTATLSYTDFASDANVSNGKSYDPYNITGNNANLINIYPIAISNLYKITPGFSMNNYDSSNNYWGLKMTYHKVVLYSSGGWTIIENHVKPTVYITVQYTKTSS